MTIAQVMARWTVVCLFLHITMLLGGGGWGRTVIHFALKYCFCFLKKIIRMCIQVVFQVLNSFLTNCNTPFVISGMWCWRASIMKALPTGPRSPHGTGIQWILDLTEISLVSEREQTLSYYMSYWCLLSIFACCRNFGYFSHHVIFVVFLKQQK